jgi:hypothetical protein
MSGHRSMPLEYFPILPLRTWKFVLQSPRHTILCFSSVFEITVSLRSGPFVESCLQPSKIPLSNSRTAEGFIQVIERFVQDGEFLKDREIL